MNTTTGQVEVELIEVEKPVIVDDEDCEHNQNQSANPNTSTKWKDNVTNYLTNDPRFQQQISHYDVVLNMRKATNMKHCNEASQGEALEIRNSTLPQLGEAVKDSLPVLHSEVSTQFCTSEKWYELSSKPTISTQNAQEIKNFGVNGTPEPMNLNDQFFVSFNTLNQIVYGTCNVDMTNQV